MTEEQYRRLFAEHARTVYLFALRRVGADLADDIVADTFLVAWRRRDEVPVSRERAWLLTTAQWVMSDARRSAQRRVQLQQRLPPPGSEPDPANAIASSLDAIRALATLRPPDREVLRLVEWDQLTHAEAATVMGCSVSALSVRLRRARRRFAKALAEPNEAEPQPAAGSRPLLPTPALSICGRSLAEETSQR